MMLMSPARKNKLITIVCDRLSSRSMGERPKRESRLPIEEWEGYSDSLGDAEPGLEAATDAILDAFEDRDRAGLMQALRDFISIATKDHY